MRRPTVAVTTWRRPLPTPLGERTVLYTLADEYVACIVEAGATPLLLPHLDELAAAAVVASVDGLVLSGGGDVQPSAYDGDDSASRDTDAAADRSEMALVRAARARGLPTLAICRGMQVTNVAFGGSLLQEVGGAVHGPADATPGELLSARHQVTVEAGTRLAAVHGPGDHSVNTIHHQAVDRLADGFRASATAPDGVIEAIEPIDDWPMLGVQWHPEKHGGALLFDAFVSWLEVAR